MEVIRGWYNIRPEHHGCVATIGNFDGVHLGHRALIGQLATLGPRTRRPDHPSSRSSRSHRSSSRERTRPPRLTRLREKLNALRTMPLDRVALLRFDARLCAMSPVEFVESFLVAGLGVQVVVAGDDFRFGYRGEGQFRPPGLAGASSMVSTSSGARRVVSAMDGVSSSWIRDALANDELEIARELLGRPYAVKRQGRACATSGAAPSDFYPEQSRFAATARRWRGVYAVRVAGLEEQELDAVANIGTRPTVDRARRGAGGARLRLGRRRLRSMRRRELRCKDTRRTQVRYVRRAQGPDWP